MATLEKNYEVDNRTGTNHEGRRPNDPVARLTASSIIDDRVENTGGDDIGVIKNLMINIHSGEVEYAVLEFGSIFGIGGKLFAVPFSELRVHPDKEAFILDREKEYLKEAPGFDQDHWPDTNDHRYFDDVNLYYREPVPPIP